MLWQRLHRVPRGVWQGLWCLCMLTVLVLALIPLKQSSQGIPHADKLAHAVAFAGLAFLAVMAWPHRWRAVALGLFAFGAAIEVMQGVFTASRQASWLDLLADAVGIAVGLWLGRWALRRTVDQANQANTAG
jgi:VanZ family protein